MSSWLGKETMLFVSMVAVMLPAIYIAIFAPLSKSYSERCWQELMIEAKRESMRGHLREASKLYESARAEAGELSGAELKSAETLTELAILRLRQEKKSNAIELLKQSLLLQQKAGKNGNPRLWLETKLYLGNALAADEKLAAAQEQWKEVLLSAPKGKRKKNIEDLTLMTLKEAESQLQKSGAVVPVPLEGGPRNLSQATEEPAAEDPKEPSDESKPLKPGPRKNVEVPKIFNSSNLPPMEKVHEITASEEVRRAAVLNFNEYKDKAAKLYKKHRYDESEHYCMMALKEQPNAQMEDDKIVDIYEILGRNCRRTGRHHEHLKYMQQIAALHQKKIAEAKKNSEVIHQWEKLIASAAQEVKRSDFKKAEKDLQSAMDLCGEVTNSSVQIGLTRRAQARMYRSKKDPEQARYCYEQALRFYPNDLKEAEEIKEEFKQFLSEAGAT